MPLAEVQKLAESGDVSAQNDLALRYSLGAGGAEKDLDKGIGWFRRAALNGSGKMSTQAELSNSLSWRQLPSTCLLC